MLRKFEFFGVYGEVFVKSIDEAFVTKDGVLGALNFGNFYINSFRPVPRVYHRNQQQHPDSQ